jgi:hypothetical protein
MSNQKEVLKYCQTCKGTYIYPRWTRCENCQKEEAMSNQPLDIEDIRLRLKKYENHLDNSECSDELTKEDGIFISDARDVIPALCDEVEALRDLVSKQGELVLQAYKLIVAGILTEEGGDPDAGIDWINNVDAFNARPVKRKTSATSHIPQPVEPTKG